MHAKHLYSRDNNSMPSPLKATNQRDVETMILTLIRTSEYTHFPVDSGEALQLREHDVVHLTLQHDRP